jgi:hypothetical protein
MRTEAGITMKATGAREGTTTVTTMDGKSTNTTTGTATMTMTTIVTRSV